MTPDFFRDFQNAVATRQCLPEVKNFLPKLSEVSLNTSEVDCGVREERAELFKVSESKVAAFRFVMEDKRFLAALVL